MRVLPYYIVHTVINSIKKLFKTWVAIFIAICLGLGLVGGIIGVVVGTVVEDSSIDSSAEEIVEEEDEIPEMTPEETEEMQSFITGGIALLTFIVILFSIYGGDKSGAKIFTMPDVNFLFASPMKPQSILMFRMILQMGVAIVSSIYLLFQLPNLTMNVGLSIKTCLIVVSSRILHCLSILPWQALSEAPVHPWSHRTDGENSPGSEIPHWRTRGRRTDKHTVRSC